MKRENRLKKIEKELAEINIDEIQKKLETLKKEVETLKKEVEKIEEPYKIEIEKLEQRIKELYKRSDEATEETCIQITEKNRAIDLFKRYKNRYDNLLKERIWLEGLNQIKEYIDKGFFITDIEIKTFWIFEEYALGNTVGDRANWNTPSRIMDIQLSEKTFKIKSEIAKTYRSISLEGRGHPKFAKIILADGIKIVEGHGKYTKQCPVCTPERKSFAPVYGVTQYRCPICGEEFWYRCKNCGHEWEKEPTCEHKDRLKMDGDITQIQFIFDEDEGWNKTEVSI